MSALDVIFAIDDSSSISGKQFRGLKTFLANVVDSLDIGMNAVRIGVIKYARGVKDEIRLDDFFGKEMLKAAILKIKHERGGTRTGKAITRMVSRRIRCKGWCTEDWNSHHRWKIEGQCFQTSDEGRESWHHSVCCWSRWKC